MLNLTRPRYVMPFHGDHKRIHLHGQLAESVGIDADNIFKGENGLPLELDGQGRALRQAGAVGDDLRRRRRHRRRRPTSRCATAACCRADGIFVVVATISEQDGSSVAEPEVIFRGVPYPDDADELLDEIRDTVEALAGARRERGDPRDRPAPAGPPRRPRGVRLRAPAPPPDGAAGRRRGLDGADAGGRGRPARRRGRRGRRPARRAPGDRQRGLRARRGRAVARGRAADRR